MQQRRLRPGDVLDDYCPRERRITDHAIVAMIDDEIKQTRCVACDTEHEYKQGRVPVRKKKAPAGLFDQVLDGLQGAGARVAPVPIADFPPEPEPRTTPSLAGQGHVAANPPPDEEASRGNAGAPPATEEGPRPDPDPAPRDEVPFRRPLIRAQLPRIEGQTPTRTLPDFTIRQPQNGRPGRPGGGGGRRRSGGGAPFQGPMRSGRSAHGQGGHGPHGRGEGSGQGRGPERGGQGPHRGGRGRRGKKR